MNNSETDSRVISVLFATDFIDYTNQIIIICDNL